MRGLLALLFTTCTVGGRHRGVLGVESRAPRQDSRRRYCKYPFDPYAGPVNVHPNPVWTGPTKLQGASADPYIRDWLASYDPTKPAPTPSTSSTSSSSPAPTSSSLASTPDPFETPFNGLPPTKHNNFRLTCETGTAFNSCPPQRKAACDAFCQSQCFRKCNYDGTQRSLMDCLAEQGMSRCAYNYEVSLVNSAKACRKTFVGRDGKSQTAYILEPSYLTAPLYNVKRIKRASISLPLVSTFELNTERPDFGNFVKGTDGFDVTTCSIDNEQLPWSPVDLALGRNTRGTVYKKEVTSDGNFVYVHEDIRTLVTPAAVQSLGGFPRQFVVWWTGTQPSLWSDENGASNFTLKAKFTVTMASPRSHFFLSQGLKQFDEGVSVSW